MCARHLELWLGLCNQEENMCTKINPHTKAAAEMFNVAYENVTPEQRRKAKTINYGIAYGMTKENIQKIKES
jgi:DNA polymerase I-like protein with 3'-5' exonuclease and polymerase domains